MSKTTQLHQVLAAEADALSTERAIYEETAQNFRHGTARFQAQRQVKKTLAEGFPDEIAESRLVTSVRERLEFTMEKLIDPMDIVLTKEQTNGSGTAKAELIVGDKVFGDFTATALIAMSKKLKRFRELLLAAPTVNTHDNTWIADTEYEGIKNVLRGETEVKNRPKTKKVTRLVEGFTAQDPKPQTYVAEEEISLGTVETTKYSSELLPSEKSEMLERIDTLITAVSDARSRANSTAIDDTKIARKLLTFVLNG